MRHHDGGRKEKLAFHGRIAREGTPLFLNDSQQS
jgi:hypothetical protein